MSAVTDIPGPPTITTLIGALERIRAHRGDLPVLVPAGDDPVPSYTAYDVEIDHVVPVGRRHYWRFAEPRESNIKAVTIR